eukprot:TRINITY_DN12092_c0_g1_i3.p4 TRINITY_DN12092_c0_g1~~TRINITY_DN12092_c0_g1_i3.p4  ORF type:complete len:105 (-),score=11.62 TRINITY_DN12092_c0_g1_i3:64-378(-)
MAGEEDRVDAASEPRAKQRREDKLQEASGAAGEPSEQRPELHQRLLNHQRCGRAAIVTTIAAAFAPVLQGERLPLPPPLLLWRRQFMVKTRTVSDRLRSPNFRS